MDAEPFDIFLSYAHEDEEIARRLYNDLSSSGFKVWRDKESLKVAQNWPYEIKKAIRHCRYFLALVSFNSVTKNGYVQSELAEALNILSEFPLSETFIVPVRIENCKPIDERLLKIQWEDLFPSYEEGLKRLLLEFKPVQTQIPVMLLQEANESEISNAIDVANATQISFKFNLQPSRLEFDKSAFLLPNGAVDFDRAFARILKTRKVVQELLPRNPIFITSLPYSDKQVVEEYKGHPLLEELSQCYFHDMHVYPQGISTLISTFIWDHLPANDLLNFPMTRLGRRTLQPFLLFEFAAIAVDPFGDFYIHDETRGCPFDYCDDVRDIDEAFRVKSMCAEHTRFLQDQVLKNRLTRAQMDSGMKLFDRAFGKGK